MAGLRTIKNRIKSTRNVKQMARAMEAVSAVKMRRSVSLAQLGRPYALAALTMLRRIRTALDRDEKALSELLSERPVKKSLLVVITSDRGLAGAFNGNVIRVAEKYMRSSSAEIGVIAIGKKGRDYFKRRGILIKEFLGAGDFGAIAETKPIAEYIQAIFSQKQVDEVVLVYANFLSALKQEVVVRLVLPFNASSLGEFIAGIPPERGAPTNASSAEAEEKNGSLLFEPPPAILLRKLLPALLEIEIHSAILEANASEHASRMMAMKSASDNASDLIKGLTISFNNARQAGITRELAEITAGKEALATQ